MLWMQPDSLVQLSGLDRHCDNLIYADLAPCYGAFQLIALAPPPQFPEERDSQAGTDISAGYRIARANCRTCHVIGPEQTTRPILIHPGPNFQDIANRPGLTVESLSDLISRQDWDLQSRPVQMPKRNLSEGSIRQVAVYILSLRK